MCLYDLKKVFESIEDPLLFNEVGVNGKMESVEEMV